MHEMSAQVAWLGLKERTELRRPFPNLCRILHDEACEVPVNIR